ncbi:putative membrane protein YczE [Homoserinimonas aerilata]|uniref:Putative membrane protein YczE n=2 Tax=Homoserinimonas aerilata TaxID=1162970 RepID=A0A542XX69_9MICO|nr:putative membrane protein YczE [Homoserinimonas aerilata]
MTRRITQLLLGLALFGLSITMMLRGVVGIPPWDVFTQGFVNVTGLPFGMLTIIISVVLLLAWIPLRQKPGIGTVGNALLVGAFIQLFLGMTTVPEELWQRILLFAAGLVLNGFATGLYIGARFGPGPRDGLMTGLHRVTGKPIWLVRTSIEIVVVAIGWMLGGNVGIGTLAFALLIGPLVHFFMPLLHVPPARSE